MTKGILALADSDVFIQEPFAHSQKLNEIKWVFRAFKCDVKPKRNESLHLLVFVNWSLMLCLRAVFETHPAVWVMTLSYTSHYFCV